MTYLKMLASAAALSAAIATPLVASAASSHRTFDGTVEHISSTNIKVHGVEGGKAQTLSFLVNHGTNMTKLIHAGEYVRVTFDQKLLGARHADSITPYANPAMKMKT
jgi:hypothetical protein